jgi:toxin ParE1/3/4
MAFRVEYTSEAEADLNGILDWLISRRGNSRAALVREGLDEAISSLAQFPGRCAPAPEDRSFPSEVRQMFYGRRPHLFRIIFTIDAGRVAILHVWHGRRARIIRGGSE